MLPCEPIVDADFELQAQRVHVNDLVISYYELGEDESQVLVFAHGMNSCALFVAPLLRALASRFHIIAPDFPGHGLSPAPPQYTVEYFASFLHSFVDAMQLTDFVLFGHSMGGEIAMQYVTKHPVRALALSSPAGFELYPSTGAAFLRSPAGVLINWNFIVKKQIQGDFERFQPELQRVVSEFLVEHIEKVKTTQREVLQHFQFQGQEHVVEQIKKQPTLAFLAEFDSVVNNHTTERLLKESSTIVWLKTYHEATYQIPKALAEAFFEWARQHAIME